MPYPANIDIRDTVNYKQVMKQYQLGPNGGIVTSLNLFATKFDQVLKLVESKKNEFVIIDTPGQIEVGEKKLGEKKTWKKTHCLGVHLVSQR